MKKILLTLILFLPISLTVLAQDRTVSGKVTSKEDGSDLIGVSVVVKGTTIGANTDINGGFRINLPAGNNVLVFSYVGFVKKEVAVSNESNINVQMESDAKQLKEIVVTGYGEQDRKTLTSAISSVSAAEIENIPVASSDQLLQGRAAGVQVNSNSGTPGGGITVRVRGTSSINASSDPLYVVDGIPIQSNNLSNLEIGGGTTSPIADINPADIESMEILKDASATAIYGARAANGVVLITTKRGKQGKAKVSLGAYYGAQKSPKLPQVVDGPTFERLMNEAAVNNGRQPIYSDPANTTNTNWGESIFQTGALRNIDLGVSGGNEKIQYLVSGNNFLQEGIIKNTDFTRNSARINLDFYPADKFKIGTSILYSKTGRSRQRNDDNISGSLGGAFFYPSNLPMYQPNGAYTKFSIFENPLTAIKESEISMVTNRLLGAFYGEYEFIPGLRLRSSFSVDYSNIEENIYDNTFTNAGAGTNGSAQSVMTNDYNWIQENVLSYEFGFGDHSFNTLFGTTLQESEVSRTIAWGTQFPSNDFKRIASAAVQRASSTGSSWGIGSLFTRIGYDYKSKYLATINVRRDASSRFGEDYRWGTFPSLALGWVISEEPFFKDKTFVSTLKVRGSYGITGNQSGINDFQALGLWTGAAYADIPGVGPEQLANPELKWETTKQTDIGVDIGLFNNRINIIADYYYKKTEDLLLAVPVPRTSGFNSLVQNFGELENKGFELNISADVVQKTDFKWNMNFNIAHNKNKILKLAAPFNVYNRDIFRYEEGGELFSFYLHEQTGVDPETGAPIFADVNGDGQFRSNIDRKIVGSANPDFFGGITNTLNYKAFDLSFFFQYSYGNEQLNWNRFFLEHGGTRTSQFSTSQLDRWQKPGDRTMVPRMTSANYASDLRPSRFLEDGSYMRLKNITLGYALPTALINKIGISSARVYVSGQNVFTITDYTGLDPEITATAANTLTQGIEFFSMPQPKVFMGGFNISF
ncbi:SusC/RagA family TonB-linked outer membrane protein [Rufibacter tibetensis]|uniref:SusC/RagA family TonB-linked outer membrane protein n=1 Tax=Rufibacter tibetensis TaxID=512763 RepID=A0A0P0C2N2_9BACT|nr:TonB-dependent receptor [Rufibacter tibetensis]ALI98935.1 SusC/RagA family TonB-linked outer membrane protein [Rufibacter tibetensis]